MKLIKKIKETFSYKTKYEDSVTEIENLNEEVTRLENINTSLEKKLDDNTQALMIERLETTIIGYRETIKKLRESDNKRMKANIENKEKIRVQDSKIKELEQEITDLKSNRYLVKTIPSGRKPNTIKTKVKQSIKPSVQRYMKNQEVEKYEEVN